MELAKNLSQDLMGGRSPQGIFLFILIYITSTSDGKKSRMEKSREFEIEFGYIRYNSASFSDIF